MKKLLILLLITFSSVLFSQNKTQTVKELETECNKKDYFSCTVLAYTYLKGDGVSQDKLKAIELFQKACDGTEIKICTLLGNFYNDGENVSQDKFKAVELY